MERGDSHNHMDRAELGQGPGSTWLGVKLSGLGEVCDTGHSHKLSAGQAWGCPWMGDPCLNPSSSGSKGSWTGVSYPLGSSLSSDLVWRWVCAVNPTQWGPAASKAGEHLASPGVRLELGRRCK